MARSRAPVPFGGGIDRESGLLTVNASVFEDLRNVHLLNGRVELRKGLGRVSSYDDDATAALLEIHPLRSRSQAAHLLLRASGDLALWLSAADGSGATELDTIAAAGVTGVQRYVMTDVYNKLFIAHDEPDTTIRQPTRYWDFGDGTLHTLQMSATDVKFRGVDQHLAYLLGWGWGGPGDEDRPEMLRISLAGQPTTFDPQHYFLAGNRGEPITGGGASGTGWSIKKLTSGYRLVGSQRADFGVGLIEREVGLPIHRLGVSVNGTYYFWSSDGPRRESGGQSEDLSPGLRLLDTQPDVLAAIDTETGFATFDPTRKEVLFVFGRGAYVFHLNTDPQRWSYREYGVPLGCGAVLYESSTGALAEPPDPAYVLTLSA